MARPARQEASPPQGDPDALDPHEVMAALQRGIREADRAPATHPTILLAQNETENERDDPSDPLASLRVLEFRSALDRLHEIDPKAHLTFLTVPGTAPTQGEIDDVNNAIAAALAAKQADILPVWPPTGRPAWQLSERDVGIDLGPSYTPQISYKDGKPADYGTPGSVRPDFVSSDGRSASFEIKNYDLKTNTSGLVNAISSQALKKRTNLPAGMQQNIIIDVRG